MEYKYEQFIDRIYKDLYKDTTVEKSSNKNDSKYETIKKYLERLENIDKKVRTSKYNGMDLLKKLYYDKYIVKEENIPESYFENQKKIALDRGYGHIEITDNERKQMIENIINDQKKSLDIWLDYLNSEDSIYPEWFKYYVFQGMVRLGSYNKETCTFNKRTKNTVNIFIELNREALALIYDNLCKYLEKEKLTDETLNRLLNNGSFSKIYAYMIKKLDEQKKEILDTEGIWIKYDKGSNPEALVKSLEGKGTGWCTAGIETARTQLQNGDFHVYYTKDSTGEYSQPRIAIRMENDRIGEIRGINKHQNLEPEMKKVVEEKIKEFPDRDKYKKKVSDMEKLTKIYDEYKTRELTEEEIRFLYEIDNKIDGFGYQKDPRIKEILEKRNYKKDLSRVFRCNEDEISNNKQDVLDGKKLVYFYGSLNLSGLTNAYGLVLPETIRGDLFLERLISANGLILPKNIGRSLDLNNLTNAKGLVLPQNIGCTLNLSDLTSAEGLVLPKNIGINLFLDNLKSLDGVIVPKDFEYGKFYSNYITMQNLIDKSMENNYKKTN